MRLSDILRDIPVLETNVSPDTECTGITYDSRAVKRGDLFVAVKGYATDGHRFIASALEKGAAAVLCEDAPAEGAPFVRIENTRLGLALAAANFYRHPAKELKVIGITGTNDKTTTAFLVKQLLEKTLGAKVGLVGSICNMIGAEELHTEHTTPESCDLQALFREMADAGCGYCVMEVSSHSLVLDRVAGIPFAVGVFTNLTQDHLDFHKTMEEYARAKSLLFTHCAAACANLDDGWESAVLKDAACPVLTFAAEDRNADLTAQNIRLSPAGVYFEAEEGGERCPVTLGIPGRFSVYNGLTALAVCRLLGIPLAAAAAALAECRGAKGRVESVPTGGEYSIFIDYAVTPDAIENVLTTLRQVAPARLVMLFGCGGDRDRKKRPIMGEISARLADFVIVTSDNPRTERPEDIIAEILPGVERGGAPFTVIPDRIEAIEWAIEHHEKDDVILLCGKGHEDYQIIGHEKIHMDEREIVADCLARRAGK